jgi:hypothetical protein
MVFAGSSYDVLLLSSSLTALKCNFGPTSSNRICCTP